MTETAAQSPFAPRSDGTRRCVVHIGLSKTGTTAIQSVLHANWGLLKTRGLFFPNLYGERYAQISLSAYVQLASGDDLPQYIARRLPLETPEKRAAFVQGFPARLHNAINEVANLQGPGTVLLSCEDLSLSVRTDEQFRILRELIEPRFDEVTYLVYIRRQEDRILSRYSQTLRGGVSHTLDEFMTNPALYDTRTVLDRWAAHVGRDRLHVRLFDRSTLDGGDLMQDFFGLFGVNPAELSISERSNEAYWPEAVPFLVRMNQLLPELGDRLPAGFRARLVQALDGAAAGREKLRLTPEQAQEIRRRNAPHEKAILETYFPERETLFPERPLPAPQAQEADDEADAVARVAIEVLLDWWDEMTVAKRTEAAARQEVDHIETF
ncbi:MULTISPECIES: hypothetical protein [Mameliella]|uniref:hypothetical protein n=1 Tax=Mameliella TaxID=1434019 RepID=UPI000B5359DD|nr:MULTISPECIES: hypothetical protein [Mameliella]MCR9275263.1 hypothetical protein [Paracoccaceae bacterium]OWV59136.1 hypothetical protein CDZ98_12565 [Mameliella alba]